MVRDELRAASQELRDAAAAADGDLEERIYQQSNQLAETAAREQDPDHGRLARHTNALHDLLDDAGGEIRDSVERAIEHVETYREGVEGV